MVFISCLSVFWSPLNSPVDLIVLPPAPARGLSNSLHFILLRHHSQSPIRPGPEKNRVKEKKRNEKRDRVTAESRYYVENPKEIGATA